MAWEYRVRDIRNSATEVEKAFNQLGDEGFELVTVTVAFPQPPTEIPKILMRGQLVTPRFVAVFKRQH